MSMEKVNKISDEITQHFFDLGARVGVNDYKFVKEKMSGIVMPKITLNCYQQDWIPGFAAFIFEKGKIKKKDKNIKANLVINIGSWITAVKQGDIKEKELPYFITETIIHELVHVLQAYFGTEFSEKKIHKLTEKYQKTFDLENADDKEAKDAYKKLKNK